MALPPTIKIQTLPKKTQIDGDSVRAFEASLYDDIYKTQISDEQLKANLIAGLNSAHLNDSTPIYGDDVSNKYCEQLNHWPLSIIGNFDSKNRENVPCTSNVSFQIKLDDDGLSCADDVNAHYSLDDGSSSAKDSTISSSQNFHPPLKPENNLFSAEKIAPEENEISKVIKSGSCERINSFPQIDSLAANHPDDEGIAADDPPNSMKIDTNQSSLRFSSTAADHIALEDEALETRNIPLAESIVVVTEQLDNNVSKGEIDSTRKTVISSESNNVALLPGGAIIKNLGNQDPTFGGSIEKEELTASCRDLNESGDSSYIAVISETDFVKTDFPLEVNFVFSKPDYVISEEGDEAMGKERLNLVGSSGEICVLENQDIDIVSGQPMLLNHEYKASDHSPTDEGKITIFCEAENEKNVVKGPSDLPLSIPHLEEMDVCQDIAKKVNCCRVKDSSVIFEPENEDADACVQDNECIIDGSPVVLSLAAQDDVEDEICTLQEPPTNLEKEDTYGPSVVNLVRHEEIAKGEKKHEKGKKSEDKNELGKTTGKKGKKKKGKKSAKRDISKSGSCSPPSVPQSDSVQRIILKRGQQWNVIKADSGQLSIVNESGLSDNANGLQSESHLSSLVISPSQELPVKDELLLKTGFEASALDDAWQETVAGEVGSVPLPPSACEQSDENGSVNTFQISIEDLVQDIINGAVTRSVGKGDSNMEVLFPSGSSDELNASNNDIIKEIEVKHSDIQRLSSTQSSLVIENYETGEYIESLLRPNSRKITGRSDSSLLTDLVEEENPGHEKNCVISFDATLSIVTPSLPVVEYVLDDSSSSSSRRSSCSQNGELNYSGDDSDCSNSVILAKSWRKKEYGSLDSNNDCICAVEEDNICDEDSNMFENYGDGTKNKLQDEETFIAEEAKEKSSNPEDLDELGYVSDDSSVPLTSEGKSSKANENLIVDSSDLDNLKNRSIKEQIERILGERLLAKECATPFKRNPVEETREAKDEVVVVINVKESKATDAKDGRPRRHKYTETKGSHRRPKTPLVPHKKGEIVEENKSNDEVGRPSNPWNFTYLSEDNYSSELNSSSKDECSDDDSSKCIVHRWKVLESKAMDRQRQSSQLRQFQRQMKNLRLGLESISDRCSTLAHPHSLALPSQLKQKVEEAKNLLEETEKLKSDISSLNVVIHRFVVDVGPSVTSLKEDVAELYRIFDDTQRRVNAEIIRLESAEATWRLWEEQKQQLMDALKQDKETLKILDTAIDTGRVSESITASVEDVAKLLNQKRRTLDDRGGDFESSILSNIQISITDVLDVNTQSAQTVPGGSSEEIREDHLSDSGTSGYESCSSDDLSERERRLAYLRRLARDLEANLAPGSKAWSEICQTLSQAEKELRGLQSHCQNLILKTAENLEKGSLKPPGFAQTSNNKRRNWPRENKRVMRPDKKRSGRNNRGWVGRVARAALPFQVALLLLFCVACLLEPNCCDSVNTLNLSFSPQLRYVHGAPPT